LMCISVAAHVSHVTLAVALSGFVVFALLLQRQEDLRGILRTAAILLAPICAAAGAVILNNAVIHKSLSLTPAGQSFLLANLIEYGPARDYLRSACPSAPYKICVIANRLPPTANQLLWSGLYDEIGGFKGMSGEASTIVRETIRSHPLEVITLGARLFYAGLLTHEPGAELVPVVNEPSMREVMQKKFSFNINGYLNSAQSRDVIPHHVLRSIDAIVFPLTIVILLLLSVQSYLNRWSDCLFLILIVTVAYALNTALCAVVSGVWDRYQSRITWLFLLSVLIIFSKIVLKHHKEVGFRTQIHA